MSPRIADRRPSGLGGHQPDGASPARRSPSARLTAPLRRLRESLAAAPANTEPKTPWVRASALGAGTGLAAGMALAGAASGLAGYFARMVVTPVKEHVEDLEVLAVVRGADGDEVILPATPETVVPGTYGLNFHGGRASARIGEITSFSPRDGTIARRVEKVYHGDLRKVSRGWWTSVPDPTPADAGHPFEDVLIDLPGGPAPAWHVPPRTRTGPLADRNVWAIMVHGRGGRRTEGIRALGVADRLGIDSLLISYRNDGEAPDAPDGRYGLGITEWEDVDAAVQHALDQGAEDVLLFGWSMGGAVALQTADRSRLAPAIRGLVLTGPVVDWIDVLAYQARANRIPEAVGRLGRWFISHPAGRRVTGLAAPVDLKALNWIDRAEQLHVRTLILHSSDDDVVPYAPSRNLAERNEKVSFVPFTQARHVKEWNHDPQRWESSVEQWVAELFTGDAPAHLSSTTRRAR
ncbi:alpha/beta hydrolase family protein [Nesterenkonia sp. K-15-9-6]|uniref:alpha/beta hydrolase family protein n=1 Tax=Nesterenkonia sp. K-15-9-6 TaxID=3093918 RepID=UPI0040446B26